MIIINASKIEDPPALHLAKFHSKESGAQHNLIIYKNILNFYDIAYMFFISDQYDVKSSPIRVIFRHGQYKSRP